MSTFKITTYLGNEIDFKNIANAKIDIVDIAHALSMTCRYGGHIKYHYSVAQHSVAVAELAKEAGISTEGQLYALLHDATEAYMCDIPRPLKALLNDYSLYERNLNNRIMNVFRIEDVKFLTEAEDVQYIDYHIVHDEVKELFIVPPSWIDYYESVTSDRSLFRSMQPHEAKELFLRKYNEISLNMIKENEFASTTVA